VGDPCVVFVVLISVVGFVGNERKGYSHLKEETLDRTM
jgi:hypothetical protein